MSCSRNAPQANQARILLAEDDMDLRQLFSAALARHYQVVEACDGNELLSHLLQPGAPSHRLSFDLVITDCRMPGASGLDALRVMALLGEARRTILLSAYLDDQLRGETRRLGASLLLAKPVTLSTLLEAVAKILARLPPL